MQALSQLSYTPEGQPVGAAPLRMRHQQVLDFSSGVLS
jgi:hypothetical protein